MAITTVGGFCDGASECKWPVTLNKPMDTCLKKHRAYTKMCSLTEQQCGEIYNSFRSTV